MNTRPPDSKVLDAICRADFASFAHRCFSTLYPGSQFQMTWHIRAIAWYLEQVRQGKIKRLIINMAPGTLKSFMTSVAWPAFILGHEPGQRIAVVNYGFGLATDLGNSFRQIIDSPTYERQFPFTRCSGIKNSELEVMTTQNGFRKGTTVEGALTGLHADILIIDDPLKATDASSFTKRERVNTWFGKTAISRLNDPRNGAIVIVMQRLHEDDLTGMLLRSSEDWTVLSLPAIAEAEERIAISEHQWHVRRVGDALHPERQTTEELYQLRSQVGAEIFAAQWQQNPTPERGTIIQREWFQYYDELPSTSASPIIQAWDLASKDGDDNDFSVATTWLYHEAKWYLMDEFRGQMQYPLLRDNAVRHVGYHRPNMVLFEDDILGNALAAEIKAIGFSVGIVPPQASKAMRTQVQAAKFRDGRVLFPKGAYFVPEMEVELLSFPRGRRDDRVDSVCLALSYEPPSYDLTKLSKGMKDLASALWWNQQLYSRF